MLFTLPGQLLGVTDTKIHEHNAHDDNKYHREEQWDKAVLVLMQWFHANAYLPLM
jgi:hypothetical protein